MADLPSDIIKFDHNTLKFTIVAESESIISDITYKVKLLAEVTNEKGESAKGETTFDVLISAVKPADNAANEETD